jgi:acyl-CoA reductase-like NAD-dependent aldehyde dehydrogenase
MTSIARAKKAASFEVRNPGNGEVVGTYPIQSAAEVDAALRALDSPPRGGPDSASRNAPAVWTPSAASSRDATRNSPG